MTPQPLFNAYPLEDYRAHQPGIEAALLDVLRRGQYILGDEVSHFENEFAAWNEVRHAIGVANGTDAIELLLRGLGIGSGCGVAVPSHTAVASVAAIARAGAKPVFVDVDPVTFTMEPESLELALNADGLIKAALAVHLYGHPADVGRLRAVCERHGCVLLEDAAQAHGATISGRRAGGLARGAAFSFYPTKNLGAIGDGGAVTTDDDELAGRIRELRQYGWRERYISATEGINSRLDEMQAAILRVKLRSLAKMNAKRVELAARYTEGLRDVPHVAAPVVQAGACHVYHLYVVRTKRRDALMKQLSGAGVPVGVHYPAAVHRQPAYAGALRVPLPNTEALTPEILSLPLHPYLSEAAIDYVLGIIRNFREA